MPGGRFILLIACLLLLGFGGAVFAQSPAPPGPKERCAVCGMFVAPHGNWVAQIVFKDGTRAYFDGPKDLFIYVFDLAKYRPGTRPEEIAALYATEYYSTRLVNLREVFLVSGSDVLGPMGQELVPVAGRDQAETFRRDHGGKKLLQFDGATLIEAAPAP